MPDAGKQAAVVLVGCAAAAAATGACLLLCVVVSDQRRRLMMLEREVKRQEALRNAEHSGRVNAEKVRTRTFTLKKGVN